jgi:hypothetical protein
MWCVSFNPCAKAAFTLSPVAEEGQKALWADCRLPFHNHATNSGIRLDANAIIDG